MKGKKNIKRAKERLMNLVKVINFLENVSTCGGKMKIL